MESEGLLQCPYDKNHMIRPSRFPYHLVKCRENNKAIAKDLATCPFNARHRMPKQELQLHMKSCENRCQMEPLPAVELVYKDNFSTWQGPPCEEDWEDESSSAQPTFVLNGFGNNTPYNAHDYASNTSQPSATYGQSQGGHTNAWKPKVEKSSCVQPTSSLNGFGNNTPYNAPDYASNTSQPGATYGQSQGGYTNAWKPKVKSDIKSEGQLKPVSSLEDWPSAQPTSVLNGFRNNTPYNAHDYASNTSQPSATYGQSQGGYTNAWKPKVEKSSCVQPTSSLNGFGNNAPDSASNTSQPGATYGQSQGGYTNAWKPKVKSDIKSESQLKPVTSLEDWPSLETAGAGKAGRRC